MKRWSLRQAVILLLGVFVALGVSLSAVQTSNMAANMTMASAASASGHDGCAGCAAGNDDYAKAMACASICSAPAFAVLPRALAIAVVKATADVYLPEDVFFLGRVSPPDPYPPRLGDLG
jgi:hypothetical protein